MDDLDKKLIAQLGQNARVSIATLARRLGVARTTIQARIERLENRNIIAGYTLKLGENARRNRLRATALLQIEPRSNARILQRLEALPQIECAHTTSGRFDLILQLVAETTQELDETLDSIGGIPGVQKSESLIHLTTRIDRAV